MAFPSIRNVPSPRTRNARRMFTDWVLIARAAAELQELLAGSRVREVGQLSDGRFALVLWKAGGERCLAIDVFAPTPLLSLETDLPVVQADPGFFRAAGATLSGMLLTKVRARRGDRLIRADFSSRSRFGVSDGASLMVELVPRFGNIILLKGSTIVAALKEFTSAQNASRQIAVGHDYEPPPLNLEPRGNGENLAAALEEDPKQAAKELRLLRPLLPAVVAESLVSWPSGDRPGAEAYRDLLKQADGILQALGTDGARGPVIAYRKDGELVQAHLVALNQHKELASEEVPLLLPLLAEARASTVAAAGNNAGERQRAQLAQVLRARELKLAAELKRISEQIAASGDRDRLRGEGEAIFARLHELPQNEQGEAKNRAAKSFAGYKKLVSSLPHLQQRRESVERSLHAVAELQWELERSTSAEIDDVADAVSALQPHKRRPKQPVMRRKRRPFTLTTTSGSRILVGRSPRENAELTFVVARPDDLWFHAQKIPGAHVILQRDDKQKPPDADVERAASLAAYYSKGKQSPKVTVDYTQRKYVRKQPGAPPGLVFYTNVRSLTVTPSLDLDATS